MSGRALGLVALAAWRARDPALVKTLQFYGKMRVWLDGDAV